MAPTSTKRKAASPAGPLSSTRKRHGGRENGVSCASSDSSRPEKEAGVVQRAFYSPEISNKRCEQYNNGELPRPLQVLSATLHETKAQRERVHVGGAVVHWFKRDLRINDNRGLAAASEKAQARGVPLNARNLKEDLARLNIPLYVATVEKRVDVPHHLLQKCEEWGAKHVFCNMEYEVDELRREAKLVKGCLERGISFTAVHDDVIVPPEVLKTGGGKQYSVYSPWFRTWIKHIDDHPYLLGASEPPAKNADSAREDFRSIFDASLPHTSENKSLSDEQRERFARLWPAGEHEAQVRLRRFLREKIANAYFSAGTLAARTAVRLARDSNSTKKLGGGNPGISGWISELGWRDFYKHVLAHWPYVCMHKPFKYEYANIAWENNLEHFQRWCAGQTGFPIVDAAMRQLKHTGYMHNRCRMIVASFLAKDLLIDWRMGERFLMESLIDGDFASNNGGWGFSASSGVDPQPYFRISNPVLQSEKFDGRGDYIQQWVKELERIEGSAVHDPYARGAGKVAEKAGYPRPMVHHKESRERALAKYKEGLARSTANVGGGVHNFTRAAS